MPDYGTINTARFVQRYFSAGNAHSHTWRCLDFASLTAVKDELAGFYESLNPLLPNDYALLDASFYPAGSSTSGPTSAVGALITSAGNPIVGSQAYALSFVARGGGGSNFKVSVFGVQLVPGSIPGGNYRVEAGELANVSLVIANLAACTSLLAIDNTPLLWKSYANYRVDAYWQKESR